MSAPSALWNINFRGFARSKKWGGHWQQVEAYGCAASQEKIEFAFLKILCILEYF